VLTMLLDVTVENGLRELPWRRPGAQ